MRVADAAFDEEFLEAALRGNVRSVYWLCGRSMIGDPRKRVALLAATHRLSDEQRSVAMATAQSAWNWGLLVAPIFIGICAIVAVVVFASQGHPVTAILFGVGGGLSSLGRVLRQKAKNSEATARTLATREAWHLPPQEGGQDPELPRSE